MREIKFRAWDKDNKRMKSWEDFMSYTSSLLLDIMIAMSYPSLYANGEQRNSVLLQFTGLKDKNGKEIYEGDIVEWKINFSSGKDVIVFRDGRFELSDSYIIDSGYRSVDNINTHGEIIGNIYENPELINHPLT